MRVGVLLVPFVDQAGLQFVGDGQEAAFKGDLVGVRGRFDQEEAIADREDENFGGNVFLVALLDFLEIRCGGGVTLDADVIAGSGVRV